jgi:predicted exporter
MKNKTLSLNDSLKNLSQKKLLGAWIFYHAAVLIFFLASVIIFRGKIGIDSDLFNLVPKSISMASVKKADEKMMSVTSQNIFILVANEDFSEAKKVAQNVYEELKESKNFETVSLYNDVSAMGEITDFLYKYRSYLIDEKTADTILASEQGAQDFALEALSKAYGGFTMLPLDNIDTDPFLLTEYNLQNYLSSLQNAGTAMSVKDGVLASKFEDKWYVMIRGILSSRGAKLASKDNAITEIYRVCDNNKNDSTSFVYSGTPFHSHESSTSASREISVIATVSMLAVIILLIFIFRSVRPLVFSVASILISLGVAVLMTLSVFHKMHVITLVFGTSLIGSCIDYSLHFFTHWAGNTELKSSTEIRNHIFSGLLMAIISTGICFAILLFAPFTILKQMSLFCLAGLVSSFLTTIAIYPFIPLPKGERVIKVSGILKESASPFAKKIIGRIAITGIFAFAILSLLICHKNFKIKNDLNRLYTMEGRILEDKKLSIAITKYNPTGWFIVRGNTEQEALENEELLCRKLDERFGKDFGYIATTNFIPTIAQQKKSRLACQKLMELAPLQYEDLGFEEDLTDFLQEDFEAGQDDFISIEKGNVPKYLIDSIATAWLGQIDGKYYTDVMPALIDDNTRMREIADGQSDVFFVNKLADMGSDLDKLTIMVIKFFILAYAVMFIALKFFYKWKQALKIISVPLLIMLMTAAIFTLRKTSLEFFSVTGLILVFGLGLDYIIYMMENEKERAGSIKTLEPFATLLSFITTIISFGALSLSTFQPVHLMGLSIFIGLATAYISSMLYDRSL